MTRDRPLFWPLVVLGVSAPLVLAICVDLWRMPVPLSEAVGLFEDVARPPASRFLVPETSYYRPLYHLTLAAIWNNGTSLDARLAVIKAAHIVPLLLLVGLFVVCVKPRNALEAAAASVGIAVLLGSPGLRDNLEVPLIYTIVGMPIALMAWIVLNRQYRWWHGPLLVLLALIATGFKEQGLVIFPLIAVAWWMRAPGVGRNTVAALVALGAGYVVLRLNWREYWPLFEQAIGLGFGEIEPAEAVARFGSFPYLIYAYNGASTVANILFSEPSRGIFRITRDTLNGSPQLWELNHLASSVALTAVIAWWGIRAMRRNQGGSWSPDARLFAGLIVVVLACGALSFNYSRDRLGGMAVPFYALAAFAAVRAAAMQAADAAHRRFVAVALGLCVLAGAWQLRAVATMEYVRVTALRNQLEWMVSLHTRRAEFASRPTYLRIMEAMVPQGTSPAAPQPTRLPGRVTSALGWP